MRSKINGVKKRSDADFGEKSFRATGPVNPAKSGQCQINLAIAWARVVLNFTYMLR